MSAKKIIDRESFIKYIQIVDKNNLEKYLKLIDFYENTSIHNLYFLSSYIFQKIENRLDSINNLYNYFFKSLSDNIKKLNDNIIFSYQKKEIVPKWFYKKNSSFSTNEDEKKELYDILNKYN